MNGFQKVAGFLGRLCISIIFILAAINQFMNFDGAEQNLVNALCNLMTYMHGVQWAQTWLDFFMQYTSILLIVAAVFEILGGLLVLFGIKVRLGATLLILFLIPTTFVFHHFWYLEGDEKGLQTIMFLKNLSIFGGLLLILAFGTGTRLSKPHAASHDH